MLRFLTAGESHGPVLTAIIEGLPAGLPFLAGPIDAQLSRRQQGYGRGGRMKIEKDTVKILSGVRLAVTTGAPVTLQVENRDWANWTGAMSAEARDPENAEREAQLALRRITKLRPGHADWAGALKYNHDDIRDVLERASARETTMRVAVGAVAREMLEAFGIRITSHVTRIGSVTADLDAPFYSGDLEALHAAAEASPVRCPDPEAEARMIAAIDQAKKDCTSLGGIIEVRTSPLPIGLGSHVHWDRRLDGRIAQAIMSIHALKGVEFGLGFGVAERPGFEAHDTFQPGFGRPTNYAGGVEGGMTNGQPLVVRAAMKPIATMPRPLDSVDLASGEAVKAHFERADACAVPAAGVIAEAMVAWVLAEAFLEKYGGDSFEEIRAHYEVSQKLIQARLAKATPPETAAAAHEEAEAPVTEL
jgi:chorismate synthase